MKIMPKTIPGMLHNMNKNSCDWGWQGLISYGCQNVVVVVDPPTVQIIQVLDCHSGYIMKVTKWARENYRHNLASPYTLRLAASDFNGHIYIWDVVTGKVGADCCDGTKPVSDMEWVGVQDISHDLLLALHPPYHLILWNTENGSRLWRKAYTDLFQTFSFDPFDPMRIAFLGQDFVVFVDDFTLSKAPVGSGKKFYISSPSSQKVGGILIGESSKRSNYQDDENIFVNAIPMSNSSGVISNETSMCLQLEFHKSRRHHLILMYSKETLVLDLEINQTVGVISIERSGSPFLKIMSISQKDAIICLHENGSLSLRVCKLSSNLESDQSMHSNHDDHFSGMPISNDLFYDHVCQSDGLRVTKHNKVIAGAVCPVSEKCVALVMSTGKTLIWELQSTKPPKNNCISSAFAQLQPKLTIKNLINPTSPKNLFKFLMVGLSNNLSQSPIVVRMCPPLTTKNFNFYQPLLAVGSASGNVFVFNLSGGQMFKELSVHTSSVKGIEWIGLKSFLSYAYQNPMTGNSGMVRNELMFTDLDTGRSFQIRGGTNEEEPPIEMIRVSYLKQYFCVVIREKPLEIWDVRSQTILRQMPKNFPHVTALEWSPSHNIKNLKKKTPLAPETTINNSTASNISMSIDMNNHSMIDGDATSLAGQSLASTPTATDKTPVEDDLALTSVREHFVFTDTNGLLHHYIVDANVVKEGSKIPPDASMGSITGIAWKSETLVLTDSDGNMNVWDLKGRLSRTLPTGRGGIKKIKFAPGRGNMKLLLLYNDGVEIWDAKEMVRVSQIRCPRDLAQVFCIDWAASDRPVIACSDNTIRITDLELTHCCSAMEDNQVQDPVFCPHSLPPKAGFLLKTLLQHQSWRRRYHLDADEFTTSKKDIISHSVLEQLEIVDVDVKAYLCSTKYKTADRCFITSLLFGDESEVTFWSVALHYLKLKNKALNKNCTLERKEMLSDCEPLETCYDVLCEGPVFRSRELNRIHLHEAKRGTGEQARKCADNLILLGQTDRAVQLLLETEPDSPNYYSDSLKACLAASIRSSGASQSTIKLVATNLIANGQLSEGIQLLCMIDKGIDACRYLQTYNKWHQAAWLAKVALSESECADVLKRWADHLASPQVDQKDRAVLVLLSLGLFERSVELMYSQRYFDRAALFLEACEEFDIKLTYSDKQTASQAANSKEPSDHMTISQMIFLEYARILLNLGLISACEYYCRKAGCKGEEMLVEINQLLDEK
ncbi:hypothetical protein HELRODRAFT_63831 [Helobdella robusta]|uniref:Uncharacterized protein n=1 Tax=Helobdella robusta TaxID=6412 RepID=T1FXL0_HELRO|nr:hypothetical protein HELRODRAFT_63831 [Helobdella robusta]ESO13031.1 hypothetical protein HELRODRAFT_63831 [Helobdella robusta]